MLWIELEAAGGFILGLGLASLMGQRLVPVILLIVLQMILTPILSAVDIPHLHALQRSVAGVAMAHLEPSGLPAVFGLPGVTGGVARPGAAQSLLPESATQLPGQATLAWLGLAPGKMHAGWFVSLTNCKSFVLSGTKT